MEPQAGIVPVKPAMSDQFGELDGEGGQAPVEKIAAGTDDTRVRQLQVN